MRAMEAAHPLLGGIGLEGFGDGAVFELDGRLAEGDIGRAISS